MNVHMIKGYNAFYVAGKSGVSIVFENGQRKRLTATDPHTTLLWLDILRNEKPVFYNSETGMLYSGEEPVGEGE